MKLIWIVFLLLGCVSNSKKTNAVYPLHPLAIVQGVTSDKETFVSILSPTSLKGIKYFYAKSGEEKNLKEVLSFYKKQSPSKNYSLEHLHIKNLDLESTYSLVVKKGSRVIDQRSFKALDLNQNNLRIGVVSCVDDKKHTEKIWQSYLNKFPDLNFFIGDNVYADRVAGVQKKADYRQLWQRYIETFNTVYFYHAAELSPTLAIWDDHDYGDNDGGVDYDLKEQSLEVLNTFFPRHDIAGVYEKTLGAGAVFKAFNQDFVFIDNRSFRESSQKGLHLGKEQTDLLFDKLKATESKLVWWIKGDQFFGGYHPYESYEGNHPNDFRQMIARAKKTPTKAKLLLVSGDRHLTEVMKIDKKYLGYPTYEVTSSGMHVKVYSDSLDKNPNPRQWVGKAGVYNYTIFNLKNATSGRPDINVTSYGEKDWVHYSKDLVF